MKTKVIEMGRRKISADERVDNFISTYEIGETFTADEIHQRMLKDYPKTKKPNKILTLSKRIERAGVVKKNKTHDIIVWRRIA